MKKVNIIFEQEDFKIFKDKCYYFLDGSDGQLKNWGLPEYGSDLGTVKLIEFSIIISEKGDKKVLDELQKYLIDNISLQEKTIAQKEKEIEELKKTIKVRKSSLEIAKSEKTFYSFFKKIISQTGTKD